HLRQLYTDPITDQAWLLIHSPDGGITGVASSSLRQPLKRANFSDELIHFQESVSYQDWQFIFVPIQAGE
ncbi:MAG: type II secretion system protein, partial [Gammaproteobacteria bacterium]|nr:type II secretion system protein [Gammaproteobacteria bacterium]